MKKLIPLFVSLSFLVGCQPDPIVEEPAENAPQRTQEHLLAATLFVQHSAEYEALCLQAYRLAEMQLRKVMETNPEKPAVILDLDETVLDNSAYSAWQIINDQPYTPETWAKWTNLAVADEVPGSREFLILADSLGVKLFYISNRDSSALDKTIKNMREFSMPQLNEDQFMLKTTTSGKKERRAAVEEMGHSIVLLIGDNLGDFDEKWDQQDDGKRGRISHANRTRFGADFIILPNPIYGTWLGEIYEFSRDWTASELDSIRFEVLVPAPLGSGNQRSSEE